MTTQRTEEMENYLKMVVERNAFRTEVIRNYFPKGGVGVEVGVLFGDFSAILLKEAKCSKLHLVDPWAQFAPTRKTSPSVAFEFVQERFKRVKKVVIHRQHSKDAAEKFENESLDFVYIDGNHSYLACMEDLKAWYPKVKSGGILSGDDFGRIVNGTYHGVVRALPDFILGDIDRFTEIHILRDQYVMRKK